MTTQTANHLDLAGDGYLGTAERISIMDTKHTPGPWRFDGYSFPPTVHQDRDNRPPPALRSALWP